jgi:MinD superfamily P-loop ATPase
MRWIAISLIVLCAGCAHCRLACEQRSLFTSTTILLEISHESRGSGGGVPDDRS